LELFDSKHKLCEQVGTDEWAWKLQTLEVLAQRPYPSVPENGEQAAIGPAVEKAE
jgi:hypothetical protein